MISIFSRDDDAGRSRLARRSGRPPTPVMVAAAVTVVVAAAAAFKCARWFGFVEWRVRRRRHFHFGLHPKNLILEITTMPN